jgi:hypothetical protein
MPDSQQGHSDSAALVAQIEAMTNASVSTRPPILSSRHVWKALAHGGSSGLRVCSGTTEIEALERLLASVQDEPGIPTR